MNKLSDNDSKNLKDALESNELDLLKWVPKTDLHAHSFLSVEFDCLKSIFGDLTAPPEKFKSLKEFIDWLTDNVSRPSYELDYAKILNNVFSRMIKDGVVYGEISFDIKECIALNMKIIEWVAFINEIYSKHEDDISIAFEYGINRADDPKESIKRLEAVIETGYFSSIDLYGDEDAKPISEFKDIFSLAKSAGLKLKCHVGEVGSAKDVKDAVELLDLASVQHGVAAAHDEDVMKFLKERGTILNTCVSSNIALGVCSDVKSHPIRKLFDAGVKVSLNTDDYLIFSKDVSDDIMLLYKNGIFNISELEEIINNGLSEISVR